MMMSEVRTTMERLKYIAERPDRDDDLSIITNEDLLRLLAVADAAKEALIWQAYLKKHGGQVGVPINFREPMDKLQAAVAVLDEQEIPK